MMDQECTRCKRLFNSSMDYEKHIKSNRCKEPYECEHCNYITNRKSDYEKHIETKKCKDNHKNKEKEKKHILVLNVINHLLIIIIFLVI
jgi:uncharacterized C2H2 Zn-finger protein